MKKKKPSKNTELSPFATNLRRLLAERKLNAAHLARLVGIAPPTLHGWMNGTAPTDLLVVLRLSETLGVDFQELVTGISPTVSFDHAFELEKDPVLGGFYSVEFRKIILKKPKA